MFYDLSIFSFIWFVLRKRARKDSFITGLTLLLYSAGRFFIEGLRADSLYLGKYRIAQIMSLMLITIACYIIASKKVVR
jgi:phosphatidylglycerol:prolipoprotein diacylglycerol transferase